MPPAGQSEGVMHSERKLEMVNSQKANLLFFAEGYAIWFIMQG